MLVTIGIEVVVKALNAGAAYNSPAGPSWHAYKAAISSCAKDRKTTE
jgi:hypothetical protein